MMARDAPDIAPMDTRTASQIKPAKLMTSRATGTRSQRPKKAGKKPPTIPDHTWRSNGSGWELRGNAYQDGKRKRPYVGHLSKSAYVEMRKKFKGAALDAELRRWAVQQKGEGD